MHQKTTLANGLRVVSADIPHARSVSISIFVASGSRHETDDVQGVSHFAEHMFFKGTENRPTAKEISEAIEGIGGISNAESGKEVTVYWDKVAKDHWRTGLELLADLLLHSKFEPEEVEKERKVIVEELSSLFDSPGDWVNVLIDEAIWGDCPLGRDTGGTRESVLALTREQVLAYVERHYVPANTVVAVAGALSHAEVVAEVEALFGDWPARPATRWPAAVFPTSRPKVLLKNKKTEQANICLAVPGLSYVDPERYALDTLNIILGEGMSSRLFCEIREHQGLAYDVHSYNNPYRDTGSVVVYAGVEPKKVDETISACLAEVDKLVEIGITEGELHRAKEYWKGRTLLRLEDTRSIASWMGSQELLLGEVLEVDDVMRQVEAVTAAEVHAVAARLLGRDKFSLALVGPYRGEKRLTRLLG